MAKPTNGGDKGRGPRGGGRKGASGSKSGSRDRGKPGRSASPGQEGSKGRSSGKARPASRSRTQPNTAPRRAAPKHAASPASTGTRRRATVDRAAAPGSANRPGPRRWRALAKWTLTPLLLVVLLLGGYTLTLAERVRSEFAGKRWAEPARVYARPLELYLGAPVDRAALQAELAALGYRRTAALSAPAQWAVQEDGVISLHTRAFTFWDGSVPSRVLHVGMADGRIDTLQDAAGRSLALVRLEPPPIGSLYPAHSEDRELVRRDQLPDSLVAALLAVEDRRFYDHTGIDPFGIARALVANLAAGRTVQGGSTLTQQLVKNFFLTPERSLRRKFDEMLMAWLLEAGYSKDEILEAYANEVFMGQEGARAVHGFGLAARFYFDRPLAELSLPESALLAGLVKGPSYYNPRRHPQRARARRALVLQAMVDAGALSPQQAEQAAAAPLGVTQRATGSRHRYPGFLDLVRRQLRRDYREQDLTSEGLRIFTSLDPVVQSAAERALDSHLQTLDDGLQGAVVVASAQDGEVRALLGDRVAGRRGFNRALDARRPVGSLVKPVVYLGALALPQRFSLITPLQDTRVRLTGADGQVWTPQNFDREEHGEVPLHRALAHSYNLATVNLGMALGPERVAAQLQRFGADLTPPYYPSLLLGAVALSPLEVTQVYQSIAAGGYKTPLRAIREVLAADGERLQRYPLEVEQVFDPAPTYLLTRNLVEVLREGTGRAARRYLDAADRARLGEDGLAGKTGTTDGLRDSWFAGFSGDLVSVVWVGRDDNRPAGQTGSRGALPVWARVMGAVAELPLTATPPPGVVYREVDCDSGRQLPFIAAHLPSSLPDCTLDLFGEDAGAVPVGPGQTPWQRMLEWLR